MFNIRNRSLLTLIDFTPAEIQYLVDLAIDLKRAKRSGSHQPRLQGKHMALIFEKDSTRTRCAFEVAANNQGMATTYLGPTGSQFGKKESVADSAQVLGRMFDAIEYRGYGQEIVEELDEYAGVPVYNGLTNEFHPTQALADAMIMFEHGWGRMDETSFAYVGDGQNNVANSLLIMGAKMGMDVRIGAPESLQPTAELQQIAKDIASETSARITITSDQREAVAGADFIYTDVWVSMGEPAEIWAERIELLKPWQVNAEMLDMSANPDIKFLHCLPAFHDDKTQVAKEVIAQHPELAGGMEVTDEVFQSPASLVFEQAENRVHTIEAVLLATLGS